MGFTVRHQVVPHSRSAATLRSQAEVYRRGKTPLVDAGGRVRAVDVEPADARVTGAHLSEVARSHGAAGLAQTLRGLAVTRGRGFAAAALGQAPPAVARLGADPGAPDLDEVALGGDTARAVAGSAGAPLPAPIAGRLAAASGHSFAGVRVHHDRLAGE